MVCYTTNLRWFFRFQSYLADVCSVRGTVVDQKGSVEVLMPHQTGVDAGTGSVINGKVAQFVVASEQVALLLVHHQFLNHFLANVGF